MRDFFTITNMWPFFPTFGQIFVFTIGLPREDKKVLSVILLNFCFSFRWGK